MNDLRDQFKSILERANTVENIAEQPSFKWKTRLLGLLNGRIPNFALVVGRMTVDISTEFANDEELFETSLAVYAKQITALWHQVQKLPLSPQEQAVFFVESVKELSLTYNG
ncbi:MAG: hypothetical protein EBU46_06035 [Nitrosomonadaceae bacterium]|nr:hypothetical protein [Nitrosomonadaceae bacterium]